MFQARLSGWFLLVVVATTMTGVVVAVLADTVHPLAEKTLAVAHLPKADLCQPQASLTRSP
jgi:hypothetical protein